MRHLTFAIAIAISCIAQPSFGSQIYGAADCGMWLRAKAEPESRRGHELWLAGYLSGMNIMHDKAKLRPTDPLGRIGSMNQAFVWMDNYCQANPLKWVTQGANNLWDEIAAGK